MARRPSPAIWPGEAVVHVSLVNWIKGSEPGPKRLYIQEGNDVASGWRHNDLDRIGSSLSFDLDVTKARDIAVNAREGGCYQGQTHGHEGFLLEPSAAKKFIADDKDYNAVSRPFLTSDDCRRLPAPIPRPWARTRPTIHAVLSSKPAVSTSRRTWHKPRAARWLGY
jgi:hypothetical protein